MMTFDRTPKLTGEWECMECGYIEEGTEDHRPAKCTECTAPASALEFFAYDEDDENAGWDEEESEDDEDLDDEDLEDEDDEDDEDDER
jgi:hypothetical protein